MKKNKPLRPALQKYGLPVSLFLRPFPGSFAEIKISPRPSEAEFWNFCAANPERRIELNENGSITVETMLDPQSGAREMMAIGEFSRWFSVHKNGVSFSPNIGYSLPDGSVKSPDVSWISEEKKLALPVSERKKFPKLVPDFVIEVRSTSDRLPKLKKKMAETWIKNGVRLAWLIDPFEEKTWIYRADGSIETVAGFDKKLSGESVCVGFELDLVLLKV